MMEKLPDTVLVIFGITGDLAKRKLLPALYHLADANLLPEKFHIAGISRQGTTVEDIISLTRKRVENTGEQNETVLTKLAKMISIVDMNIKVSEEYSRLLSALEKIERDAGGLLNRLFYLAIPANLFGTVVSRLGKPDFACNENGKRDCRFLVEKPFGYNLETAQKLISVLDSSFDKSQIFRIDHYLAKETAQNILAFRFENPLFSGAWNNKHISHILITAVESIGIEGRTSFYENMGALRDLVQSHLLQLLALVTMNRPTSMNASDIHHQKELLLSRIRPPQGDRMREDSIRGQYRSYREETGIADSQTETFAALRLSIDTDEWRGVPIFIRTGKAIREKVSEISIVFSDKTKPERKNYLTIRIQPNEGIVIDLHIKKPGFDAKYEQVQLDFCYNDKLSAKYSDAYERVLFDAMRGDQTLFATSEEVLSCWRITEPILASWAEKNFPLHIYENNSWGPPEADKIVNAAGTEWLTETHNVCSFPRIIPRD